MMHLTRPLLARFAGVAMIAAGLMVGGCDSSENKEAKPLAAKPAAAAPLTAVAVINGAGEHKDKISGTVVFVQKDDKGVEVVIEVKGLTPGKHGIHIHEKTDLSDPELKGAGGHWNPDGHKHGGPGDEKRHAGDLGNITADEKGVAKTQVTLAGLSIKGEKNGVVGHSVIIHEKEDDLKTDPSGNSGARIAGGAIELKPEKK